MKASRYAWYVLGLLALVTDVLTREPYTLDGDPISVQVPYIGRFVPEHIVTRPLAYAVPEAIASNPALTRT